MPSVETNAQSFRTLIRTRTICLGLMILLLWWVEDVETSAAVIAGWEILFLAVLLSLVFGVLGKIKKITGLMLPLVFLIDSSLVGLWVSVSGGPVSFYMPFFLLILVSAILILPSRTAIAVVTGIMGIFLATLYWDYHSHIPSEYEAGKINFIAQIMEESTPEVRSAIYRQQGLRWFFFFILMITTCVLLMRQVWQREERLRVREKTLEQKRHLIQMGELTGRVAHGVNTPLGLISGHLEFLIAETRKGSGTHKKLKQIEQYVQRAIRTVRDILDYSRQSLSEIKPVALPKIIQAVTAAVQPKLKRAGGKLILDVDPKLPEILGYPEGLFQVLLNLVENAVDSIPPGGLVTLSAHFHYRSMRLSAHDQRGEIKIIVRDTGRGISAEELGRIFEPFYSTKGFGKGTGLGLAIVKRIVAEHQGDIKVESRLGEGTVFTLLLPTEGLARDEANSSHDFYYNNNEVASRKKETSE
jgi:signal transduction histidine kinase